MLRLTEGNLAANLERCYGVLAEHVRGKSFGDEARSTASSPSDALASLTLARRVTRLVDGLPPEARALYRMTYSDGDYWQDYCVLFTWCWVQVQPLLEGKRVKARDRLAALRALVPHEAVHRLKFGKASEAHGYARLCVLAGKQLDDGAWVALEIKNFKTTYAPVWEAMVVSLLDLAREYDGELCVAVDAVIEAEAFDCAA